MGSLLAQLIPTALVGAVAPVPIGIVITLLASKAGLAKASCFALAILGTFAVIGVVALATASTRAGSSEQGRAVTGTIIAVLGGLLIVLALKQLVDAPDPDAPPPKFMQKLEGMSPLGAAAFGLIIAVINVKTLGIYLGGVSMIVNADVSTGEGWFALVLLLVLIQAGVIAPVLATRWRTTGRPQCSRSCADGSSGTTG